MSWIRKTFRMFCLFQTLLDPNRGLNFLLKKSYTPEPYYGVVNDFNDCFKLIRK